MLSITLQVNLHIVVHACQHCVGDAFWSHNQNKSHVFEDDENKATITLLKVNKMLSDSPHLLQLLKREVAFTFTQCKCDIYAYEDYSRNMKKLT